VRFVIADDMAPALRFIGRVVRQAGHEVVGEATNGRRAVDLCAAHHPDVAVLDNAMPVLTGKQAAEIILRDKLAGHVIMVTTLTQGPARKQLETLGCTVVPKTDEEAFLQRAIAGIQRV
jgi:two-component system, response regulator PdtaR